MDLSSTLCQTRQELVALLAGVLDDSLAKRLEGDPTPPKDVNRASSDWLKWCRAQKGRVAVVEGYVPTGILPEGVTATLADIKVSGGKKRVPDDKIYNDNPDLRLKVARGNTVAVVRDKDGGVSHDGVVFALRKFTGMYLHNWLTGKSPFSTVVLLTIFKRIVNLKLYVLYKTVRRS